MHMGILHRSKQRRPKQRRPAHATLLFACTVATAVHADNWQPLTGAATLQDFVSGATAEIQLQPGVTAVGKYNADGTAGIEAWNETFPRTWAVKGDDQVCYSSEVETHCFSFEKSSEDPSEFRSRNVETGEVIVFRILDADTRTYDRESAPGEEGGLASPSAADIAAALSDPNTTLGTMNFQFDCLAYDGDIPGAGDAEARRMVFQPSLPYPLTETTNLFVRPAIPVIFRQDVSDPGGDFDTEGADLGAISFDAALGKTLPGGFVVLGGLAGTLPTATNDSPGLDQWLLGPEAAVAVVRPWGVLGVLVSHQWEVAGEGDCNTGITGGCIMMPAILAAAGRSTGLPHFSCNHEADSDNGWIFPPSLSVVPGP